MFHFVSLYFFAGLLHEARKVYKFWNYIFDFWFRILHVHFFDFLIRISEQDFSIAFAFV